MKKKKGWLTCVLLLLSALSALICKKDKHKKHPVYKFSFHLKDQYLGKQILTAENASQKISELLRLAGCGAAQYHSYATEGESQTDNRETLVFAVYVPPEKKARDVLNSVKGELNLANAWYIKEEHSYAELKKAVK